MTGVNKVIWKMLFKLAVLEEKKQSKRNKKQKAKNTTSA